MIANTSFVLPEADTKQIEEQELQIEEPTGAGLVVDITHAGVCHTDIHVREGGYDMGSLGFRRTPGTEYPLTMGDAGGDWPWWRSWETGYDQIVRAVQAGMPRPMDDLVCLRLL